MKLLFRKYCVSIQRWVSSGDVLHSVTSVVNKSALCTLTLLMQYITLVFCTPQFTSLDLGQGYFTKYNLNNTVLDFFSYAFHAYLFIPWIFLTCVYLLHMSEIKWVFIWNPDTEQRKYLSLLICRKYWYVPFNCVIL